jgi:predicted DNA-binding protein
VQSKSLKPTTIRFTEADEQVLEKLKGHTGLGVSQIVRAAVRSMLRDIESK